MNNKGQSILSEYVMIFFVVIAAATAMTVFVQRAFEARVHDAKDYAIDSLTSSGACDANCLQATGGNIAHEYEPYYTASVASVLQNQQEGTGLTPGNAQITGTIFNKATSEIVVNFRQNALIIRQDVSVSVRRHVERGKDARASWPDHIGIHYYHRDRDDDAFLYGNRH